MAASLQKSAPAASLCPVIKERLCGHRAGAGGQLKHKAKGLPAGSIRGGLAALFLLFAPGCAKAPLEERGGFFPLDPETLFFAPGISGSKGASSAGAGPDQGKTSLKDGAGKTGQSAGPPPKEAQKKHAAQNPPAAASRQAEAKPDQKKTAPVHGEVYGAGRLLHSKPLSGVYSKEYYLIRARLRGSGSWLLLHSHFTGFYSRNGIQIGFSRKGHALKIHVSAPRFPRRLVYEEGGYFSLSPEIDFTVSVQNGGAVRAQIWNNYINRSGALKAKALVLGKENLLADTFEKAMAFYSRGGGALWGAELNKAELIRAARISPKKYPDGSGMEAAWIAD